MGNQRGALSISFFLRLILLGSLVAGAGCAPRHYTTAAGFGEDKVFITKVNKLAFIPILGFFIEEDAYVCRIYNQKVTACTETEGP